jgi:hypothetical protein
VAIDAAAARSFRVVAVEDAQDDRKQ